MRLFISGLSIIISIIFSIFPCYGNDVNEDAAKVLNERLDFLFGEGASERYKPFIRSFQDTVRQNDPVKVSTFIQYPIVVRLDNKKVKLYSAKDFIKYYPRIFTPEMRAIIIKQEYETLFSNWRGVAFGKGVVWVSETSPARKIDEKNIKVILINTEEVNLK